MHAAADAAASSSRAWRSSSTRKGCLRSRARLGKQRAAVRNLTGRFEARPKNPSPTSRQFEPRFLRHRNAARLQVIMADQIGDTSTGLKQEGFGREGLSSAGASASRDDRKSLSHGGGFEKELSVESGNIHSFESMSSCPYRFRDSREPEQRELEPHIHNRYEISPLELSAFCS